MCACVPAQLADMEDGGSVASFCICLGNIWQLCIQQFVHFQVARGT